jgi:hypothetical protein
MLIKTLHRRNSEKGIALILAIGFLAVLSILGAIVIRVSTQELSDAGAPQPGRDAFYTADRAVEYSLNSDIIRSMTDIGQVIDLDSDLTAGGDAHKDIIESAGGGVLVNGAVTYVGNSESGSTMPPALAEIHGTDFGVVVYNVSVETTNSSQTSEDAHVNANIVRLYKSQDEQVYVTSGKSGGL